MHLNHLQLFSKEEFLSQNGTKDKQYWLFKQINQPPEHFEQRKYHQPEKNRRIRILAVYADDSPT
jgi:hypothetical protein